MRRRIAALTAAVAAVAVLMLGVPLVVVGRHEARSDARAARVDREADAIALALSPALDDQEPVTDATLAPFARADRAVVVRTADGNVTRSGRVPAGEAITAEVRRADGTVIVLRVHAGNAGDRANDIAIAVAVFGLVAVAAAFGIGWLLARRVTAPLDELADASARLGAGDFSVSVARHGIPETDAVADALERSAARIETLVQAEREFSANASHQLRSPLTALRMRLEELAENHDPVGARAEAEAALEQADRLDETITELLALARRGRVGDAIDVDLAALVRERVRAWQPELTRAHRRLEFEPTPPAHVRAHPGGIGHVLDAVIDNALRHGSGTVTVALHVRHGDDEAEVVVGDEGSGVADEVAATAFERHVSTSGGTGVGLALARTLIEADGGALDIVVGTPTRFRLRIPLVQRV